MTVYDSELAAAYEACVGGTVAARQREAADLERRARPAPPRVTERAAEKRKARFFAAVGMNPRLAAGILHKRLNNEARQEKRAAIDAAINAIDARAADKPIPLPPPVKAVWDRWCAKCKEYRIDDPCEACNRKTYEMR